MIHEEGPKGMSEDERNFIKAFFEMSKMIKVIYEERNLSTIPSPRIDTAMRWDCRLGLLPKPMITTTMPNPFAKNHWWRFNGPMRFPMSRQTTRSVEREGASP